MPTIRQVFDAENTDKSDAHIGQGAGPSERLVASQIGTTGTSRSPPEPRRWVPQRKAEVVAAVRGGFLSLAEARLRYALSLEEYLTWQREIDRSGLAGLRVYRPQQRRQSGPHSTEQ
jgi:hypothetical protein